MYKRNEGKSRHWELSNREPG